MLKQRGNHRPSLHGNYRPEHLFRLKQAVDLYVFYQGQIAECDQEILLQLATFDTASDSDHGPESKQPATFEEALQRMAGVDLTKIDGIDTNNALKIIVEIGFDMTRWKSAKHFASWMGLCPGIEVARAQRQEQTDCQPCGRNAPNGGFALFHSKSALGAPKAITATAPKSARLVYAMLEHGTAYVDAGQDYYEERYQSRVVQNLKRKAQKFGYQLIHITGPHPNTEN